MAQIVTLSFMTTHQIREDAVQEVAKYLFDLSGMTLVAVANAMSAGKSTVDSLVNGPRESRPSFPRPIAWTNFEHAIASALPMPLPRLLLRHVAAGDISWLRENVADAELLSVCLAALRRSNMELSDPNEITKARQKS